MIQLPLNRDTTAPLDILCLGAHSDDIEIGCGGTVLTLLQQYANVTMHWIVFSGAADRAKEAKACARRFLNRAQVKDIRTFGFRDGFFPYHGADVKDQFESLKNEIQPDLILTHYRNDLHQDHRLISELTRNTWRNHLLLEYEVPKYDGDMGAPNVFVPITKANARRKVAILEKSFPTQSGKQWFDEETFWGLLRLRGLEANAPSRYAEAFYGHKLCIG